MAVVALVISLATAYRQLRLARRREARPSATSDVVLRQPGAMVAHQIVDLKPISRYLGGSVLDMWTALQQLVVAERYRRRVASDPSRWQRYFEYLALQGGSQPSV